MVSVSVSQNRCAGCERNVQLVVLYIVIGSPYKPRQQPGKSWCGSEIPVFPLAILVVPPAVLVPMAMDRGGDARGVAEGVIAICGVIRVVLGGLLGLGSGSVCPQ